MHVLDFQVEFSMLPIIISLQTTQHSHPEFKEGLDSLWKFCSFEKICVYILRDKKRNKHSIFFDIWEVSRKAAFSAVGQFPCKSN